MKVDRVVGRMNFFLGCSEQLGRLPRRLSKRGRCVGKGNLTSSGLIKVGGEVMGDGGPPEQQTAQGQECFILPATLLNLGLSVTSTEGS